jgi:alpha/beta superfamily hydrolase
MAARIQRRSLTGPAGRIELALDWPDAAAPRGIAYIGHPHPLYGGSLDNKVAATLARAYAGVDWLAVRPNFRGVGETEGAHDHGHGETDDFLHVFDSTSEWLGDERPAGVPFALAGFSFGSFVVARVARQLAARGSTPAQLVLVGTAAGIWDVPAAPGALVIHGENDETIPLADVLAWARPQELPVVVLPGADHFFHRRLGALKQLVQRHVLATTAERDARGA